MNRWRRSMLMVGVVALLLATSPLSALAASGPQTREFFKVWCGEADEAGNRTITIQLVGREIGKSGITQIKVKGAVYNEDNISPIKYLRQVATWSTASQPFDDDGYSRFYPTLVNPPANTADPGRSPYQIHAWPYLPADNTLRVEGTVIFSRPWRRDIVKRYATTCPPAYYGGGTADQIHEGADLSPIDMPAAEVMPRVGVTARVGGRGM